MYYLTELQTRPDGIVNSTITSRSSLATGLAYWYERAAQAVVTANFVNVSLTLMDQYGSIVKNELFETQYSAE